MSTSTALRPVKPPSLHEEAAYYADAITKKETLKWVVLALTVVIALQQFHFVKLAKAILNQKPIVIRVNEAGRADAIDYRINNYTPRDAEIRFFLTKWITGFYSRNHRLTPRDYRESLAYLSGSRLSEVEEENRKTKWYGKFMTSSDDDVDVVVKNIGLDLSAKLMRAHVEYEKVSTNSGGAESKRESWICELAFVVDERLAENNPAYVKLNPLGFQITDYRPEQAF